MSEQEKRLRSYIRDAIRVVKERRKNKNAEEEQKLREIVRNLIINEAELKKHRTTGKNKLEWVLSNSGFMEQLEKAYEMLVTSATQRNSFREHILRHVENSMYLEDPIFIAQVRKGKYKEELADIRRQEDGFAQPMSLQEVTVDVDIDDEKLMGKVETPENKQKKELESFAIPGLDRTGLIDAHAIWEKTNQLLLNDWRKLVMAAAGSTGEGELTAADRDKLIFYSLLLEQLPLHFDSWEADALERAGSQETAGMEEPAGDPSTLEEPTLELTPDEPEEY